MPVKVKEKFIDGSMASETEVQSAIDAKVATLTSRIRSEVVANNEPVSTSWTTVGSKFIWVAARNTSYKNGVLLVSVYNSGSTRFIEFRLVNSANAEVLVYQTVLAADPSQTYSFPITNPTIDCNLEFQVRKETSNGIGGKIESAVLEFDTI